MKTKGTTHISALRSPSKVSAWQQKTKSQPWSPTHGYAVRTQFTPRRLNIGLAAKGNTTPKILREADAAPIALAANTS